jgi:hypothetical protein
MSETERQPSLTVYRPVTDVTKVQIRLLRAQLKEHGIGQELGRQTVTRAPRLRTALLMRDELRDFYDSQDLTVNDKKAEILGRFLLKKLNGSVDPREKVPLLPATVYPRDGNTARKFLMVAHSEAALAQRAILKAAVPVFFGKTPEEVPEDTWFDDEFVTGTVLAQGRGPSQWPTVTTLDELLRTDGQALIEAGVLPAEVRIRQASVDLDYF